MNVIISFATEEFVTPEHDEVILRLTSILGRRGITGSFHVTGDYARKLRARQRADVIDALHQHEIGYHSNTHGAFPFIAGVCEENDWDEAVAILMRTEVRGILDIVDIFGRRPQYYVVEFVKAPQLVYALRSLGVDLIGYSDIPAAKNAPFAWYCGSLCFTAPRMGVESPPTPNRLAGFKAEFDKYYATGIAGAYDGVLQLFNHPYKFLYNNNRADWVSENLLYQQYNPHQIWKIPHSAMYDPATVDGLFEEFEQLIDYVQNQKGVEFISTSVLMNRYRHQPPSYVKLEEVVGLAGKIQEDFTYQTDGGVFYSPAEIFGLLVYTLDFYATHGKLPATVPYRDVLGPVDTVAQPPGVIKIAFKMLLECLLRLNRELDFYRRLPAAIDVAGASMSATPLLFVCCGVLQDIISGIIPASAVVDESGRNALLPRIAGHPYFQETTFSRGIYPEGFQGVQLCDACRCQSWSYKPAAASL